MTDSDPTPPTDSTTTPPPGGGASAAVGFARWQKILFVVAGSMVALGGVLLVIEGGSEPPPPADPGGAAPTGPSGVRTAFAPESTTGPGAPAPTGDAGADSGTWSPMFLKMGFSFFVGFAVGYALRAFMKLALIVLGVLFLALFGLSYAGWIDVDWQTMGDAWEALVDKLGGEWASFRTFMTGSLPAAGAAGVGLVTGFKKRG